MSARVLVVDDILPNVKLLEAKLTSEYYDVVTALNGPSALEKIVTESPDIVLLDVMMPGMDGFEVCRRIKANPATSHIPVIMVTALTDSADRVRGLEAGADDFLSKPVNDVALMARVRSLVRLKMTVDEWKARERTANTLGVMADATSPSEARQQFEKATILVIEDQGFEATKYMETLSKDQHDVYVVNTGMAALEKIMATAPDLLIISLNLVHEDGLRLVSHLRSNERTRSIPILMIGHDEDMPNIARGLEIGAHDYMIRPVDRNELVARVRTQIKRRRFQQKLRSNYETSLSMALTDTLTGLYNRRYLNVHLDKLLKAPADQRKPMAVLVLDLDHFKSINDTHGHAAGDEVLKQFADRLRTRMRSFDLLARTGGEEFIAVLVDVSKERACYIAERLRRSISGETFAVAGLETPLNISASIGVAYVCGEVAGIEDVIKRADAELYKAKENGRDAVYFEAVGRLKPEDYEESERVIF